MTGWLMGRPPLPVGTWGRVRREQVAPGRWVARARFRDFDGQTREVKASGSTGAKAERALVMSLTDRSAPAGDDIAPSTRLEVLAEVWFADASPRLALNTVGRYREVIDGHVVPRIGSLTVRECRVAAVDRFLRALTAEVGAPTARLARSILSGMLGMAVRYGALEMNPVRGASPIPERRPTPRALSVADVQALRAATAEWQSGRGWEHARPRATDLLDIVDALLGTGARISEVLAFGWEDFDLSAERPSVEVRSTIVRDKGRGLVRQPFPKTSGSRRVLYLPRFAVAMLMRRMVEQGGNPSGLVFVSEAGTIRDPASVRKQWRKVREAAGYGWVTPHTFRRTVATLIASEATLDDAAAQLGNTDPRTTIRHYVAKGASAPDSTAILEGLLGDSSGVSGP